MSISLEEAAKLNHYPLRWVCEDGNTYTVMGVTYVKYYGWQLDLKEHLPLDVYEDEVYNASVGDDVELEPMVDSTEIVLGETALDLLLDASWKALPDKMLQHFKEASARAWARLDQLGFVTLPAPGGEWTISDNGREYLWDKYRRPQIDPFGGEGYELKYARDFVVGDILKWNGREVVISKIGLNVPDILVWFTEGGVPTLFLHFKPHERRAVRSLKTETKPEKPQIVQGSRVKTVYGEATVTNLYPKNGGVYVKYDDGCTGSLSFRDLELIPDAPAQPTLTQVADERESVRANELEEGNVIINDDDSTQTVLEVTRLWGGAFHHHLVISTTANLSGFIVKPDASFARKKVVVQS